MVAQAHCEQSNTDEGRSRWPQRLMATTLLVLLSGAVYVWAQDEAELSTTGRVETNDAAVNFHIATLSTKNNDLPDNVVQALAVGGDGALWVGTRGGLAPTTRGGGRSSRPPTSAWMTAAFTP